MFVVFISHLAGSLFTGHFTDKPIVTDDSRIRNQKSRFFPRIEKIKSRFYNKLVWRHFGKLEIIAIINSKLT